jgi:hypothetical protein
MALRLRAVAAPRGLQWLREGWRVFARKPLAFTGLFAVFLFGAMVLMLVPWIGPLLLLASMPLLSLGFMLATREAQQDRFPAPGVFIVPLRSAGPRRRALLQLGAIYAGVTLLIMVLADWVDGGVFAELQEQMARREQDGARVDALLDDPRLQTGLLMRFGLATLLSIPFWHAPALVYWGGQPAAQSLFSSTIAVWRCRGAFVAYALGWLGAALAFALVAGMLMGWLGLRQAVMVLALPAGLTFSAAFYASLWFTFEDSFSDDMAEQAPAG